MVRVCVLGIRFLDLDWIYERVRENDDEEDQGEGMSDSVRVFGAFPGSSCIIV